MKEFFPFDVVLKFEMKLLNFVLLVVGELIILDCKSFFRFSLFVVSFSLFTSFD
jgi:hypothetical protein